MYAIVAHGNQQYKIEPKQVLEVDYFEANPGDDFQFERVLAFSDDNGFRLGTPEVKGVKITAKVIGPTQGPKIYIQKMRRRKNYRKRFGHRQKFVKVVVSDIAG
jgi:large subunit ribosomal protein L21